MKPSQGFDQAGVDALNEGGQDGEVGKKRKLS